MTSLEQTSYEPYKRYLLEIAYDGGNYSGWQIQPHCLAVQEVLQGILSKMYAGHPIHLIGSSRTDAGVHAQRFAAGYLTPKRPDIPPDKILRAVNRQLPADIKLRTVREVPLEFHARYDALGKAYTYVLNLGAPSPFADRYSWVPYHRMDVDKIRAAAQVLVGTHDYSSFVVERSMIDEAVRTIYRIDVETIGQFCCCTFVGNGFLYTMIRCLMGTLEAAGSGKLNPEAVRRILEARDRTQAPETAPPQGLFLMKVFYTPEERAAFRLEGLPFCF